MSIGKNINIGGVKVTKKDTAKPPVSVKKEKTNSEKESKELVPSEKNTDSKKLQVINESAAGLNKESVDPVVIRQQEPDAVMVAEGKNMLIIFPVGDEEYAIAIDDIKEVVPTPPIAMIPQVPEYILGVANVRGNVLAVIDLEKKFSTHKAEGADRGKFVLVIKSEEMQVAVNVINVPNTMIVKDSEVESPTNVINNSNVGITHIKGIIKKEKRMIIWIDIHEVMNQMQMGEVVK